MKIYAMVFSDKAETNEESYEKENKDMHCDGRFSEKLAKEHMNTILT